MPYWLTPVMHSVYYFWTLCEVLALAHMVWFNSDKELIRLYSKVKYTDAGKAYTFLYVVVTWIYIDHTFNK